jgi:hypothetical protein
MLSSVLIAALMLKLALEGPSTLPKYSRDRGLQALGE